MKTKVEIIEETVEYYKTNPRGISILEFPINTFDTCLYYNANNEAMCAVGRCMLNPEKFTRITNKESVSPAVAEIGIDVLNESLMPEYQGHSLLFWEQLQIFHDSRSFWTSNEQGGYDLTERGEERYKSLIASFC